MEQLKVIFARFAVPEILVTVNSLQFASSDLANFAQEYGFSHTTSSPHDPRVTGKQTTLSTQLNSCSEKVQTLRQLSWLTELHHWLVGRRIRLTVPTTSQALKPAWPNLRAFRGKDEDRKKAKQRKSFNLRHKTKDLPVLVPGQRLWIRTALVTATVQGPALTPRSYNVETDQGSLRRNRAHLKVLPERVLPCSDEAVTDPRQKDSGETVTRLGRVFHPPDIVDL